MYTTNDVPADLPDDFEVVEQPPIRAALVGDVLINEHGERLTYIGMYYPCEARLRLNNETTGAMLDFAVSDPALQNLKAEHDRRDEMGNRYLVRIKS